MVFKVIDRSSCIAVDAFVDVASSTTADAEHVPNGTGWSSLWLIDSVSIGLRTTAVVVVVAGDGRCVAIVTGIGCALATAPLRPQSIVFEYLSVVPEHGTG